MEQPDMERAAMRDKAKQHPYDAWRTALEELNEDRFERDEYGKIVRDEHGKPVMVNFQHHKLSMFLCRIVQDSTQLFTEMGNVLDRLGGENLDKSFSMKAVRREMEKV